MKVYPDGDIEVAFPPANDLSSSDKSARRGSFGPPVRVFTFVADRLTLFQSDVSNGAYLYFSHLITFSGIFSAPFGEYQFSKSARLILSVRVLEKSMGRDVTNGLANGHVLSRSHSHSNFAACALRRCEDGCESHVRRQFAREPKKGIGRSKSGDSHNSGHQQCTCSCCTR